MLSNIKNEMDTFLGSDSSYEGKEWDAVIEISEVEIFLLEVLLGGFMVWSTGIKLSDSLWDRNTIWESEWLWLLSKEPCKAGTVQEIIAVRFTDSGPLIGKHDSRSTWVDNES